MNEHEIILRDVWSVALLDTLNGVISTLPKSALEGVLALCSAQDKQIINDIKSGQFNIQAPGARTKIFEVFKIFSNNLNECKRLEMDPGDYEILRLGSQILMQYQFVVNLDLPAIMGSMNAARSPEISVKEEGILQQIRQKEKSYVVEQEEKSALQKLAEPMVVKGMAQAYIDKKKDHTALYLERMRLAAQENAVFKEKYNALNLDEKEAARQSPFERIQSMATSGWAMVGAVGQTSYSIGKALVSAKPSSIKSLRGFLQGALQEAANKEAYLAIHQFASNLYGIYTQLKRAQENVSAQDRAKLFEEMGLAPMATADFERYMKNLATGLGYQTIEDLYYSDPSNIAALAKNFSKAPNGMALLKQCVRGEWEHTAKNMKVGGTNYFRLIDGTIEILNALDDKVRISKGINIITKQVETKLENDKTKKDVVEKIRRITEAGLPEAINWALSDIVATREKNEQLTTALSTQMAYVVGDMVEKAAHSGKSASTQPLSPNASPRWFRPPIERTFQTNTVNVSNLHQKLFDNFAEKYQEKWRKEAISAIGLAEKAGFKTDGMESLEKQSKDVVHLKIKQLLKEMQTKFESSDNLSFFELAKYQYLIEIFKKMDKAYSLPIDFLEFSKYIVVDLASSDITDEDMNSNTMMINGILGYGAEKALKTQMEKTQVLERNFNALYESSVAKESGGHYINPLKKVQESKSAQTPVSTDTPALSWTEKLLQRAEEINRIQMGYIGRFLEVAPSLAQTAFFFFIGHVSSEPKVLLRQIRTAGEVVIASNLFDMISDFVKMRVEMGQGEENTEERKVLNTLARLLGFTDAKALVSKTDDFCEIKKGFIELTQAACESDTVTPLQRIAALLEDRFLNQPAAKADPYFSFMLFELRSQVDTFSDYSKALMASDIMAPAMSGLIETTFGSAIRNLLSNVGQSLNVGTQKLIYDKALYELQQVIHKDRSDFSKMMHVVSQEVTKKKIAGDPETRPGMFGTLYKRLSGELRPPSPHTTTEEVQKTPPPSPKKPR